MVVSSANCSTVVYTIGIEILKLLISCIRVCRVYVAMMKWSGEKGSPCRRPH
jgi:hypothetical protein